MTYKSAVKILVMAAALVAWLMGVAQADTLQDIKAKGVLTVGVKADYPPYGFREPSGEIVGMEVDLAKDMARRLGVRLQLEPMGASNRMQFLQLSKIDLMIATMTVSDDRRKAVSIVEPHYYAVGVGVLADKSAGIKSGADLKDKRVCVVQGAFYSDDVRKLTGQDLLTSKTLIEAEKALAGGKCAALAYDDVLLIYKKNANADKWKDFEVVQLDTTPLPWGAAVKNEDKDSPWGQLVAATFTEWHKSGMLTELEKKWLGRNTTWLLDQKNGVK